jgi:hypothetical protein
LDIPEKNLARGTAEALTTPQSKFIDIDRQTPKDSANAFHAAKQRILGLMWRIQRINHSERVVLAIKRRWRRSSRSRNGDKEFAWCGKRGYRPRRTPHDTRPPPSKS